MLSRNDIILKVELCRRILTDYKFLIDAPLVSFFQENQWQFIEDKGWDTYLLSLNDEELCRLPDPQQFPTTAATPGSLAELIGNCHDVCCSFSTYTAPGLHEEAIVSLGMSPKKQHEVLQMSSAVLHLLQDQDITQIIDFGSGKGYLPENIALTSPHVRVVGLDKEEGNTKGGLKRNLLMEKQWFPLYRKLNPNRQAPIRPLNHYLPITLELTSDHISNRFVHTIASLSGNHIEPGKDTMLIGLHACGDLTPLLLQIFRTCPDLKCIVSVGCCYHIITQRERTLCYMTEGCHKDKLLDPSAVHAYPMSQYLQQSPLYFTRNALCLAQQAPEKMAVTSAFPAKNLFFRAVFQVMLLELCKDPPVLNVGQSASRETDFLAYSKAAFSKLRIEHCNLTDSAVMAHFNRFSCVHERQLYAVYQLRTLLARVIESIILLDKVLYLDDNGFKSEVFSLFNPVVSPRCFVLVTTKS